MEIIKQNKIENLHSYDELSNFIEQTHPISEEEMKYLKENLRKIINNNEGIESDESIIRLFLNIQKILPDSDRLIYLIFQINDEKVARTFIREQKNTIIPIVCYISIQPITEDNIDWDDDDFWQPIVVDFKLYDMERIVFYAEHNKSSVVLAFIEELLPYLYKPNFSLEENLAFLLKDQNAITKYEEEHYCQGKVPISVLFQVIDDNNSVLLQKLMEHMEDIEFYMTGKEALASIKSIFNHPYTYEIKEKLREKILNSIKPNKEFTNSKDIKDLSTISFMENILYLQEEHIKGNQYFESELYKKCLDALLNHYQTEDKEKLKQQIEKYLKNVIIEQETKESDPLKRKENLLNILLEILNTVSEKEILTFFKIGIILYSSNLYTVEELVSYDVNDFFQILELIKEKWDFNLNRPEEIALQSLITLGTELALLSITVLDNKNHNLVIGKIQNSLKEDKELSLKLLYQLLNLIKKHHNHELYKGTDLEKETLKLYEIWMKKRLNTEEIDSNKLRFIFHKIIQTGDLETYLNINSLKRLTLIYKTPYINLLEDTFTLDQIEQFNPKQYNDIRNQILSLYEKEVQALTKRSKKHLLRNRHEATINTLSLKLIFYLDYELAKKMLKDPNITTLKLEIFFSSLPNSISQGFKNCLKKHPYIFNLEEQLLEDYYSWYIDLSNNLKKEITYQDIIKYESTARENLFKEPLYFPIAPNILLIQEKDFKRNAYKTSILWQEQLKRIESTIPELQGEFGEYHYQMVDLHDPDLIFLPNMIKCCMGIGDKAEADLVHAVTNKNGRIFAIYHKGSVKAISWVWRNGQVLCFDNIEVKRGEETEQLGTIIQEILTRASHDLIKISKQNEPLEEAIKIVTLGRNPVDIPMKLDKKDLLSNYQTEMYHPEEKESLYLVDSSKVQYIIGGTYSLMDEKKVTTTYLHPRKQVSKFKDLDIQYLVNSIASIRKQKKMSEEIPIYYLGYLGEDFYVGVMESGNIDAVYLDTDPRVKQEVTSVLERVKEEYIQNKELEDQQKEIVKKIINTPYEIDSTQVTQIIEEIKKGLPYKIEGEYYHGSTLEDILNILRKGSIICNYRLGKKRFGFNGDYYVCVAKNLRIESPAFESYIRNNLSIILKRGLPVLDKSSQEFNYLNPFFQEGKRKAYGYKDEFQVRDKIEFPYFEGIYAPTKTKENLIDIRKIIDLLETFERNLPIISNTSNTLINKELIKTYLKPETKGD